MTFVLRNVTKQYGRNGTSIYALRDISLEIEPGRFVVITGPSGSGKSTLLFTIGGLLRPTSGTIHFGDQALHSADDSELSLFRKNHVGYVMQNFFLVPYLTAEENVMVAVALTETSIPRQRQTARELLDKVGLADRSSHYPRELSAGQQQRVAVARALANNPSVILADEPTGNLDPALSKEILSLLRKLNQEHGISVIMVTHSLEAAAFGMIRIHLAGGQIEQHTDASPVPAEETDPEYSSLAV